MAREYSLDGERPTIRRWLLGLAVGVLLALLALPATGWLLRDAVRLQFGATPAMPTPDDSARIAAALPDDYAVQLANAFEQPRDRGFGAMQALESRFPERPSVYANRMRWYTISRVRVTRPELSELAGQRASHPHSLAEADLADFDRLAEQGERLDPTNAFFPMLRAAGLYESRHDDEARAALERAAEKEVWKDYVADEAEGQQRIAARLLGHDDAVVEVASGASILLPHYAALRGACQMATYKAIQAEREGRPEEGLRLRMAVARCGALLRVQARYLVGNAVGAALTHDATFRAGGSAMESFPRNAFDRTAEAQNDHFVSYLRGIGHPAEARWFRAEVRAGAEVRAVMNAGAEAGAFGQPFRRLCALQGVMGLVLTNGVWMVLLGLVAAAICRTPRVAAGQPLPPLQRRCTATVLGSALVLTAYSFTDGARLDMPLIAAVPGAVALILYAAIFRRSTWLRFGLLFFMAAVVSAGLAFLIPTAAALAVLGLSTAAMAAVAFRRHDTIPALGWAVLQTALVAGGTALALAESRGSWQLVEWCRLLLSDSGTPGSPWWLAPGIVTAGVLVPALSAFLFTGFSLAYRIPLTVGLARGFRGAAVPVASLLVIAFGGTVLATSVQQARVHYAFRRMVEHDGKYCAEMLGRQWPGPVQ